LAMHSGMLDEYLREILRLLNEQLWDEAERRATGLPHIAIALTRDDLTSTYEAYLAWCREWVRPAEADDVYEKWCALTSQASHALQGGRPVKVLRLLGLTRRLRPTIVRPPRVRPMESRGVEVASLCQRLIAAFEAWSISAEAAAPPVPLNLGRLGTLR
jgi:hypothetical protein